MTGAAGLAERLPCIISFKLKSLDILLQVIGFQFGFAQIGHLVADCPRKKAADNRKRQEKDRRERQNQEAQRTEDQSSGKRRDRQSQDRVRDWWKKNGALKTQF